MTLISKNIEQIRRRYEDCRVQTTTRKKTLKHKYRICQTQCRGYMTLEQSRSQSAKEQQSFYNLQNSLDEMEDMLKQIVFTNLKK